CAYVPPHRKTTKVTGYKFSVFHRAPSLAVLPSCSNCTPDWRRSELGKAAARQKIVSQSCPRLGVLGVETGHWRPEIAVSGAELVEPGGIEPPSISPTLQDLRT